MNIDTENVLHMDISTFVGKSAALLGITGSGKTNTAAVLIEELLSNGLPLTIVDIEGEYWGLKERFEVLVAGRSEHSELLIGPENAAQVAEISLTRGISVILDLSEYTQEESYDFLVSYFTRLWEVAGKEKKPYQIVLEEAHEWIPEGTKTPLKAILTRIALRGRKRGLGIILMSQRSAKVAKDVLTQTSLLFLHRVIHPTDMKVYKDLIPLPSAEVERVVSALQPGQVAVVHNHEVQVVQIRKRHTFHAGATPEFGTSIQPEIRQIDASVIRELQALMKTNVSRSDGSEDTLKKKIKSLEAMIVEKDAVIARQAEQIALLSKLSVTMDGKIESYVQIPKNVQIEQASVNHATIHSVHSQATTPVVVEATPTKQLVATIAPINEASIRALKRRLQQLNTRQYQIFKLLVDRDVSMSPTEIAAWLSVDKTTIHRNMPDPLLNVGLMTRIKRGATYHYKSALNEHIAKVFPGVDRSVIMQRLFT
jgi:uncharacterized protein